MPKMLLVLGFLVSGAAAASSPHLAAIAADDSCPDGSCASDSTLSVLQRSSVGLAAGPASAGAAEAAALDSAALLEEAERANVSGAATVIANFGGGATGKMILKKLPFGVLFVSTALIIEDQLIKDVCGDVVDDTMPPMFMYHIHDLWEKNRRPFATGDRCGSSFTGGHWDPTAACGPATGNGACAVCGNKLPYDCTPENFDPKEPNQYNPSNKHACELGDLSNMFGMLTATGTPGGRLLVHPMKGLAQLSALRGSISDGNARPCRRASPRFEHATRKNGPPLGEIRERSMVVHCGSTYANSGARLFCAQLL